MKETTNISQLAIEQYISGKLNPEAMHVIEKAALEDPFLADALEGYKYVEPSSGLSILQRQLEERIARQQENKNGLNYSWQRLSVAATAAVLFVLAGLLFWMRSVNSSHPANSEKFVEVSLTPQNSLQPKPMIGWEAYQKYIQQSVGNADFHYENGKVVVVFTVDTEGQLSNFKIKKGMSKASNNEAIRIIKEGPKWKPAQTVTQTQITIDFSPLF